MSCKFRVKPTQDITEVYQIALIEIKRFGVKYTGDINGGQFDLEILRLRFKGIIKVNGNTLYVEIIEKPLLISCTLIEHSIKKYVANL